MADYNVELIREIKRVSERTPDKYSEASIIINFLLQQLELRDRAIAAFKSNSLSESKMVANVQRDKNEITAGRTEFPHTLTAKQVKQIMNIGTNQVYELLRTRPDIPRFYIGRSPRIPRDAFFKWYDEVWMAAEPLEAKI